MEDVLNDSSEILKKLLEARANGTVIGISATPLGRTMVLTGVEDVLFDEVPIVVLKPFDIYGYIMPENRIHLEDISSVRPFASVFENPFEKKLNRPNRMQA